MVKRVSTTEAKARFSALSDEVACSGEHIIIERREVPLAALVSLADLELLKDEEAISPDPQGALALVGAWREAADTEIDAFIEDLYKFRENDIARPVQLEL